MGLRQWQDPELAEPEKGQALPFPNIDPIAFAIGPIAIRWYALAYLFGVLLGFFPNVGLFR